MTFLKIQDGRHARVKVKPFLKAVFDLDFLVTELFFIALDDAGKTNTIRPVHLCQKLDSLKFKMADILFRPFWIFGTVIRLGSRVRVKEGIFLRRMHPV